MISTRSVDARPGLVVSRNADEICRTNYENGRELAVEPVGGLLVSMRVLRFDAFTLDQSRRAVLRSGAELELRSQSFDVLNHLVEHAGKIVSKQDLFTAVWGGAARTDDSLVQCIKDIRQVLGDGEHRIIKTVHGRGYVLVAEVFDGAPPPEAKLRADAGLLTGQSDAAAVPRSKWQGTLIAAGLLIIVLAGSGWLLSSRTRQPVALTMTAVPSIAVLPLKALGDDSDSALAILADEIAAGLWRAARGFDPDIRPTSAVKDARADPKTIGWNLGVRYIVRGVARRESDGLHVNIELIEADSVRQVWIGTFGYRPEQAGAQTGMAAFIGWTLAAELLRAEVRRPLPATPGAGHYTMLGRALMTEKISAERNRQAIAYFEKAMSIEPNHFLALVHYARATGGYSLTGWLPENEHEEKLAKAEDAVLRALQQEPKSAHAHGAHGHVLRAKGEYPQAIEAFKLALLHNPHFVHARAELGRTLIDIGKPAQAIAEIERAIEMSPTDIALYTWCYWAGLAALHNSDHVGALNWLLRSLQANPSHDNTLRLMAVALADAGREEEARKKIGEFLKARPGATLDDWRRPNWNNHPEVTARRERIRATLKRLGVPEHKLQSASKP
jgi:DNA-binding winged helix-turn-helix (wHTH) protein/tetratricopeptide (TPR) repeat protein/TolB-like protein